VWRGVAGKTPALADTNFSELKSGVKMIKVTRLNDSILVINVDMIRSLQAIPETVITFTNNDKIMVKEPLEEVSQRIVEYQRALYSKSGGRKNQSLDPT
jgi:flagellar protein FlbD